MTPQEIADRFEIQDLLLAYSEAIDGHNWDALDGIFTPDAVIDYTEMGGSRGGLAETKAFLERALSRFAVSQHMLGPTQISFDGDTARGRTICHNPMVFANGEVMFCGLWYRDTFVRTPAGWRISERYEEKAYIYNLPR